MAECHPGDILRVTAKMVFGADQVQNVYHLRVDTSEDVDDDTMQLYVTEKIDAMYNWYQPSMCANVTFTTIELWNVSQDRPMGDWDWPTLTVGGASGDGLPKQCAPLILFGTLTARSQGRKYMPTTNEAGSTSGGSLVSSVLADLGEFAAEVLTNIDIGAVGEAVFGNWSPEKERFAEWVTAGVRGMLKTQRRRVSGVGS